MNEKTRRVFNGWLALSATEQVEFDKAAKDFQNTSLARRDEIRGSVKDSVAKMQTGPLGQTCSCCGR